MKKLEGGKYIAPNIHSVCYGGMFYQVRENIFLHCSFRPTSYRIGMPLYLENMRYTIETAVNQQDWLR